MSKYGKRNAFYAELGDVGLRLVRRVVVPAADRVAVQDHLCGLASADQVLHRAGLTLRAQSADKPEVSITLPNDVLQRALDSFSNRLAEIRRLVRYFQEAK